MSDPLQVSFPALLQDIHLQNQNISRIWHMHQSKFIKSVNAFLGRGSAHRVLVTSHSRLMASDGMMVRMTPVPFSPGLQPSGVRVKRAPEESRAESQLPCPASRAAFPAFTFVPLLYWILRSPENHRVRSQC